MSEEHLWELQSNNLLSDPPKRKRTPSQFASHIADFKNVLLKTCRISLWPPKNTKTKIINLI